MTTIIAIVETSGSKDNCYYPDSELANRHHQIGKCKANKGFLNAIYRIFTTNLDLLGMKNLPKIEDGDFYWSPEGYRVFTEQYHLKRGYCCESACRHCPYGYKA